MVASGFKVQKASAARFSWKFPAPISAVILLFVFVFTLHAAASDGYAAVLRISYTGVEIRRANTDAWIALSEGAEMPFGAGDSLRTDNTGRAFLLFEQQGEVMILPRTTYELTAYSTDDALITLHQHVIGRSVQHMPANFSGDFLLETGQITLTQPATLFAVWAEANQPATVAVDQGEAVLTTQEGESISIPAGAGIYFGSSTLTPVSLQSPINPARLIAAQESCVGTVDTIENIELRVRTQPGLGYFKMGAFDEGASIQLLGRNANSTWYRVRYTSDLGWVEALAVKTACTNLPVLPDTPAFDIYGIINIQSDELALLEPFYGRPADDKWFYRSAEKPMPSAE